MRALPLLAGLTLVACGGDDGDSGSDDTNKPDASKKPDGGKDAGKDAGGPTVPDTGAKGDASSGNPKLDALAGRYLIRMDVLGIASSPGPLTGEIKIASRVSTMVVAELSVDGDHLTANERVCTQDVKQECRDLCTNASTTVDQRVIDNFLLKRNQHRKYTLAEDGTFSGEQSAAQLGYDDPDESAHAPTDPGDERIWDVDSSNDVREGFMTKLSVTLGVTVNCDAYAVQKYITSFSGTLGGTDDKPEIPQMDLVLDGAEGNALGSSSTACNTKNASSPVMSANVRMVRYGDDLSDSEFWGCPSVDTFDEKMPPSDLPPP
jgi:hypothetical protein